MCLRTSSALLPCAAWLAACTPDAAASLPGEVVECALGKGAAFGAVCTIEREPEATRFVLHHPGGGFQRFTLDPQTFKVAAADGAAKVSDQARAGEHLAFALGTNRYRVPLRLLARTP